MGLSINLVNFFQGTTVFGLYLGDFLLFLLSVFIMAYSSSSRTIAKNTLMLYTRMLLGIIVSLYTSRVVLQVLGVEDYGIYGLVGGIVSLFTFINTTLSGATSRFLAFGLGEENAKKMRDIFNSALLLHLIIAGFVFLLAELVGIWIINNKLTISQERLFAANVVYQCSVVSAIVNITQVPFNSIIIAREKMDIYAYVELVTCFMKLGIVYLLLIWSYDKLILYAVLVLLVSVFVAFFYRVFCLRKFPETRFKWIWDSSLLLPMIEFSGWNLFGIVAYTGRNQSVSILINIFHGVIYNAAAGIATTVGGVIAGFAANISMAFRPAIIKEYASRNVSKCLRLVNNGGRITGLMMLMLAFPIIWNLDFIMGLWLVEVPHKAVLLCTIVLIDSCVTSPSQSIYIAIIATGKMKLSSLLGGIQELLFVGTLWYLYRKDWPIETAYYLIVFHNIVLWCVRIIIIKIQIPDFSTWDYIKKVILPLSIIASINYIIFSIVADAINGQVSRFFIFILIEILFIGGSLLLLISPSQRAYLFRTLKK